MLRFQRDLPRLPVPTLDETCSHYLQLAHPLLDRRTFAATRGVVAEFVEPGGPGERLQERLLEWTRSLAPDNWLEPFWDDWYLCDDTPLVVNVSPGFALTGEDSPQIERAARLLAAALSVKALVDAEDLEPDLDGGAPRCMREYERLFSATRIPGAVRDALTTYAGSRHVVVLHAGRFFALDVLDAAGRTPSVPALERTIRRIVDDPTAAQPSLGVLTTGGRRSWAGIRERHLLGSELLDAVERAILVLVLDDASPPGPRTEEAGRLFLHGDGRTRWFDKSVQLVVAANGVAGFCMEHSGFDGSTAVRLAELLVEHECESIEAGSQRELGSRVLSYDGNEPLRDAMATAQRNVDVLLGRTDLVVADVEGVGKRAIVRHGVSPDAFVQMAFQLAFFTLTEEVASTYESVDTKRFLHGRTEAMRSVSDESVAFVRAVRGRRRGRDAAELLRAAIDRHVERLARCKEGRGVDRHLLGLRRMVGPDEEAPAIFTDAGYATLTRSVLSTSALPSSPGVALTCFGPVVDEGYGLAYTVHDDSTVCVVTNFHGLAGPFAEELRRSLQEMDALLT
jgi:carnitine O-acetyltransferase